MTDKWQVTSCISVHGFILIVHLSFFIEKWSKLTLLGWDPTCYRGVKEWVGRGGVVSCQCTVSLYLLTHTLVMIKAVGPQRPLRWTCTTTYLTCNRYISFFTEASLGDIALTESDYNIRLAQAVTFVENIQLASDQVEKNLTLSKVQKLNELEKLRKLKHRFTKGNDDIHRELHRRRRERRKQRYDNYM